MGCTTCQGTGYVPAKEYLFCPACESTGKLFDSDCMCCEGKGRIAIAVEVLCGECEAPICAAA